MLLSCHVPLSECIYTLQFPEPLLVTFIKILEVIFLPQQELNFSKVVLIISLYKSLIIKNSKHSNSQINLFVDNQTLLNRLFLYLYFCFSFYFFIFLALCLFKLLLEAQTALIQKQSYSQLIQVPPSLDLLYQLGEEGRGYQKETRQSKF